MRARNGPCRVGHAPVMNIMETICVRRQAFSAVTATI